MNSPDTGIQQPKKVEQEHPENTFLFGKPKTEAHDQSLSENSFHDTSGQVNTFSKVNNSIVVLCIVQYYSEAINIIFT